MIVDKIKKREPSVKNKNSNIDIPVGKWLKCDCCKEIVYKNPVLNFAISEYTLSFMQLISWFSLKNTFSFDKSIIYAKYDFKFGKIISIVSKSIKEFA